MIKVCRKILKVSKKILSTIDKAQNGREGKRVAFDSSEWMRYDSLDDKVLLYPIPWTLLFQCLILFRYVMRQRELSKPVFHIKSNVLDKSWISNRLFRIYVYSSNKIWDSSRIKLSCWMMMYKMSAHSKFYCQLV